MTQNFFISMIQNLRENEDVLLYQNILEISDEEKSEVIQFLKNEFEQESLNFPYNAVLFDENAALWAANYVYITAQLILYRKIQKEELEVLLPEFTGEVTSSSMLSVDLCFRFIPNMLIQLILIDRDDSLIQILENQLQKWHYSGVSYSLDIEKLDFQIITSEPCLYQLYTNRIIEKKDIQLAKLQVFKNRIEANLGIFEDEFWKDFKLEKNINE